jgi:hypothetical protein
MPSDRNQKILEELGERLPPTAKHGVWFAKKKRDRWSTTATLLPPQQSPKPIHAECNLGLVAFDKCKPAIHTLLTSSGQRVYQLQGS